MRSVLGKLTAGKTVLNVFMESLQCLKSTFIFVTVAQKGTCHHFLYSPVSSNDVVSVNNQYKCVKVNRIVFFNLENKITKKNKNKRNKILLKLYLGLLTARCPKSFF